MANACITLLLCMCKTTEFIFTDHISLISNIISQCKTSGVNKHMYAYYMWVAFVRRCDFSFPSSGWTVLFGTGSGSHWIGKINDVLGQFGKFYSHTMIVKNCYNMYWLFFGKDKNNRASSLNWSPGCPWVKATKLNFF